MSAADFLPVTLRDAGTFLARELAPFPGRLNVMLRCVLTSAIVIVVSMALEVPSLALSLLVVFFVTQSNVVVTRLVGVLFIVGSTFAIGLSILVLKLTFDYPLLRIVTASVLFFVSVYLMRVLKIGVVFFIVAIVVIYVQSFGYGDVIPTTALGRIAAVSLGLLGVLITGVITATAVYAIQVAAHRAGLDLAGHDRGQD